MRDRIIEESKVDDTATAQANPNHVGDFFNKLDVDQAGKDKKDARAAQPQSMRIDRRRGRGRAIHGPA